MKEFKNEFSWSVSRDDTFRKCRRMYYIEILRRQLMYLIYKKKNFHYKNKKDPIRITATFEDLSTGEEQFIQEGGDGLC